ncbi:hypothetical protein FJY90_06430 [Candidatus Gottesmanbacteria bacterium]|nr:hypothetical protein [Candidatus Gottesmanbacteria bacterium]
MTQTLERKKSTWDFPPGYRGPDYVLCRLQKAEEVASKRERYGEEPPEVYVCLGILVAQQKKDLIGAFAAGEGSWQTGSQVIEYETNLKTQDKRPIYLQVTPDSIRFSTCRLNTRPDGVIEE